MALSKEDIKKMVDDLEQERLMAQYTLRDAAVKIKALQDQCQHEWGEPHRGPWDETFQSDCKICKKIKFSNRHQ